jgi:hypothetical protein
MNHEPLDQLETCSYLEAAINIIEAGHPDSAVQMLWLLHQRLLVDSECNYISFLESQGQERRIN